ncbi:DJ-1/PfpI family protein [Salarchaeum japonicum]|uniref:DJ-1/PfpI family protein n=1 Tax=Salarchaeum japonicum TaxID=555573 RepID=A0AAV3T2R4_9EURY|nr:DJ-1/PfpI family protein [Salarchaeum japonicum]
MDRERIQTVSVLVYDGFDELDAVAPYEVFANAGLDASIVSPHGASVVEASHGLRVETDPDHDQPDLVLAPGGGWNDRDRPGAWTEYEDDTIPQYLADAHESGATVAGVCTGGMLLAQAGLLDDRPATTHHTATADLEDAGARLADARVVDCGDVLTAAGVTSGLDLAFQLVETIRSQDVATDVKREMEYEPRGKTLVAR